MKIAFVIPGPFATPVEDSPVRGSSGADPVWLKAKGLAERGHDVWVLSPESTAQIAPKVHGITHIAVSGRKRTEEEGIHPMPGTWPAVAAEELLRLHQDHAIDIVDIPLDITGICGYLAMSSNTERMPAIVQIEGSLQGKAQGCEVQVPLYRFDGEISFTPSNPVESHIAILRLENFFHGVLNRHFAAHLPAA